MFYTEQYWGEEKVGTIPKTHANTFYFKWLVFFNVHNSGHTYQKNKFSFSWAKHTVASRELILHYKLEYGVVQANQT